MAFAPRLVLVAAATALAILRPSSALSTEAGPARERASVESASVSSSDSALQALGLWVCDPAVRHLLESAPASVSRGEVLGRCRKSYSKEACDAMQNALYRGSSVIDNLEYLCGPAPPADIRNNANMVGAGAFQVGTGVGFGPLGKAVQIPGANGQARTSFRGPSSPPLTSPKELDKTVSSKTVGRKFIWERPSRQNSSAIDQAADAVRVFDVAGLETGMQSQVRMPKTTLGRAEDITSPNNTGRISMNVSIPEPVIPDVIPEGGAQSAGDVVVQTPYQYASPEGDWMEQAYFDGLGSLATEAPGAAVAALDQDLEPGSADLDAKTLREETEEADETYEEPAFGEATDEQVKAKAANPHSHHHHTKAASARRRDLQHSEHAKDSTASVDTAPPNVAEHAQPQHPAHAKHSTASAHAGRADVAEPAQHHHPEHAKLSTGSAHAGRADVAEPAHHHHPEHAQLSTGSAHARRADIVEHAHPQQSAHARRSTATVHSGRPDVVEHAQSLDERTQQVVEGLLSRAGAVEPILETGIASESESAALVRMAAVAQRR